MIEPLHFPLAARRRTRFRESLNVQVKMKSTLRALPLFSFFSSHFWLFSRMKLRNCCGWATATTSGPQYFSMQHAAQMERWISSWLQSLANESKSNTFQLMSWEQNEIRLPAAVVRASVHPVLSQYVVEIILFASLVFVLILDTHNRCIQ